ncbi:hypothetical protein RN001_011693 [Aquatica leii]|uniref:beta-N-acetylhexosaminidase n=1 Tax=Aquatica leii TaxID=1421715 RepID=A0AAN7P641_9COLE|nr:hypothetical protein RN001_011693 [Aquatica leii]
MSRVFVNGGGRFDGEKIVHLDLKGAPFKVSYYSKLFPLLSKLGATGLLIEYEDMFPYSGSLLGNVPAYNAYSLMDIRTILTSAKACNLTVIPLIQTFGHMEFILKLKEFKDLREISKYPPVICPTHKNTLGLIMDMVDQIVRAHPDMDKLHIGSDEVWHLAECPRCKQFIHANNLTPEQLFLKHVTRVVKNINKRYPKLRVLMWDDHFRTMLVEDLNKSKIGSLVEPVIWKYAVNVEEDLHPQIWELYAKVFPKVWIASAFKGATGSKQYLSNATHYIENHKSWLNIVDNYKSVIKFEGICLTGWQRYDHFAVLCELLPVSLPTLGMCLRLLSGSNNYLIGNSPELYEILHCLEAPISAKCDYYGSDVLDIVVKFHFLMDSTKYALNTLRQDITVHNLQLKAIIQDINGFTGLLPELQNLNSSGRSKISAIRKYIDKFGDIAKESKDAELIQEVVSQREQLASSMDAFKKANIKAMLTLEKSNKEDLLIMKDPETLLKQRQKRNKENLVKISSSVTDQLLSISRQLADTTKRSADTLDTLVSSSDNVVGTQEELKVNSNVISQSGKLLAKYGRREFTDKILMFFAFTFFIACVFYIVQKRLF